MTFPKSRPLGAFLPRQPRLADHSADMRMIVLAAMALVVGTGGAFSAWVLLRLIALVTNAIWYGRLSATSADMAAAAGGPLTLIAPVAGAIVIGLMARFGSDKIRGHGIPEAIEAILFGQSRLSPKVALLKPISSAISIGSGGPFGAEGPIIMTGGAIGSLFAQFFHLSSAERKTLLVAGAAAGMTGIFGTPLAAILLALEIMLFEWKPRSLVPVVTAALTSLAWRPFLIGAGPLFPFTAAIPHGPLILVTAALLGIVTAFASSLLSTGLYRLEDLFHRLPVHWMWWPAIGAVVVGIGGLVDPRVLGAGYGNIQALIDGGVLLRSALLLLAAKAIVWLVALGSGTSGGILAPLLIIGGTIGAIAGHWLPGPDGFWALVGMGSMMSAAMRAPLTGAVFAVELTGRLDALPAIVCACAAGYALAVLVLRRSILTEKIARRGRHISQEYNVDPLALVTVAQIMTAGPEALDAAMKVIDALDFFEREARHRVYPVVDEAKRPVGVVSRTEALQWRADRDSLGHASLGDMLSDRSLVHIPPDMPASSAAELMITEDVGRLPVIDPDSGALIGILSRRDLLQGRIGLRDAEQTREKHLGLRRRGVEVGQT